MTDPAQPAQPQPQPAAPLTEAEDKQWASFAHLGGIIGILPSLIIWLIFKDRGVKTNVEGKEALNFQITLAIVYVGGWILITILGFIPILGWIIGVLLWLVIVAAGIASIVLSIIGFTKVNAGGSYRYPFALRLIK